MESRGIAASSATPSASNFRPGAQAAAAVAAANATAVHPDSRFLPESFAKIRRRRPLGVTVPVAVGGDGTSIGVGWYAGIRAHRRAGRNHRVLRALDGARRRLPPPSGCRSRSTSATIRFLAASTRSWRSARVSRLSSSNCRFRNPPARSRPRARAATTTATVSASSGASRTPREGRRTPLASRSASSGLRSPCPQITDSIPPRGRLRCDGRWPCELTTSGRAARPSSRQAPSRRSGRGHSAERLRLQIMKSRSSNRSIPAHADAGAELP